MLSDNPDSISVLIVDDNALFRLGTRTALETFGDIKVVGEVQTGEEAIIAVEQLHPEVVLMEIDLPGIGGIEATHRIRQSEDKTRVLMFTSYSQNEYVDAALAAGAVGYCMKSVQPVHLRLAIYSVHAGAMWFDSLIARKITGDFLFQRCEQKEQIDPGPAASKFTELSEREKEVLELLSCGLSNQDVASRLNISVSTAKTHVRNILKRLGVTDRTQAALKAVRMRIVNE